MQPIDLLPPELIREILSNLSPFDLEEVAKTFNKSLYHTAIRLLEPKKQWIKHTKEALTIFPPGNSVSQQQLLSPYPNHVRPLAADWGLSRTEFPTGRCKEFGLDPVNAPYFRTSPPELGNWLKFDGGLAWLSPLHDDLASIMQVYQDHGGQPLAQRWQVDILAKQAKDLNLVLPQGFEAFLRSSVLHYRMPSHFAWYFKLSKLIKCPAAVDGGRGGYIVRFYCDQQYCAFDYLYLSKSGNHFIIRSHQDFYQNLSDEEIVSEGEANGAEGESANEHDWTKDDVSLVGLNFEEHLATVYFEEILNFETTPFPELIEYVQHVYKTRN